MVYRVYSSNSNHAIKVVIQFKINEELILGTYTKCMSSIAYEKPREKLARKGPSSLTNTELLQVIIASGNANASAANIAKKVVKLLDKSGSELHPQDLLAIRGIGLVKAGQIIALFELATRFPVLSNKVIYNKKELIEGLFKDITDSQRQSVFYASFDGAKRLIMKRSFVLNKSVSASKQIQKLFADCLMDSAASVSIAIGCHKQKFELELNELNLIRDISKTSQLLSMPILQFSLVSKEGVQDIKGTVV